MISDWCWLVSGDPSTCNGSMELESSCISTLSKTDKQFLQYLQEYEKNNSRSISFLNASGLHDDIVGQYSTLVTLLKLDFKYNTEYMIFYCFVQEIEHATIIVMCAVVPATEEDRAILFRTLNDTDSESTSMNDLKFKIIEKLDSCTIPKCAQLFDEILEYSRTNVDPFVILQTAFTISFEAIFGIEGLYTIDGMFKGIEQGRQYINI